MKYIVAILALAVGLTPNAKAQESGRHKLLRRTLGAVACAASAYDGYQTASNLGVHGNVVVSEGNPFGFNRGTLSLKAAMCVGPLIAGEWMARRKDWPAYSMTIESAIQAGVFAIVIVHNQRLIDGLPPRIGQLR